WLVLLNSKCNWMLIAWYWMVLIALLVVRYVLHLKRYCRAFRQDRDALLEARNKYLNSTREETADNVEYGFREAGRSCPCAGQLLMLFLTNSRRL
ncbi:hypothetical protein M9Y22_13505, partial [Escherichia coli]|nr:hypothetical protein [Escherichia coli]